MLFVVDEIFFWENWLNPRKWKNRICVSCGKYVGRIHDFQYEQRNNTTVLFYNWILQCSMDKSPFTILRQIHISDTFVCIGYSICCVTNRIN